MIIMIMTLMLKLKRGDRKILRKLVGKVFRKFKSIMRKRRKRKKRIVSQRDDKLV